MEVPVFNERGDSIGEDLSTLININEQDDKVNTLIMSEIPSQWPLVQNSFEWNIFTILVSLILGLLILTTIIGNVFVIVAILVERNLRTLGNYLVFSLAVADLMVACLVMPIGAIYEVTGEWVFNSTLCDFWTCFDVLSCTASILHLVAIALDRYWAVTNIDYIHSRSSKSIGLLILIVWMVAVIISVAPILGWKDSNYLTRIEIEKKCLISQDVYYQVLATCATFYGPLVVILILYWKIFKVARERIRHKPGSRLTASSPRPAISQLEVMHSATDLGNSSEDQSSGNCAANSGNLTNVKCKQNNSEPSAPEKVNALTGAAVAVKEDSNSSSDAGEKKGTNKRIKRKFKKQIENVKDSSERVDNTTTGIITGEGSSGSQQANKETTGEECENEFEEEDEDEEEEEEEDPDGDGDEDEDEEVVCEEANKEPYAGEFSEEDCVKSSLLNKNTTVDDEGNSLPLTATTSSSGGATRGAVASASTAATASTSLATTTNTGENSSCTYGSFSEQQRTTRLSSMVTPSSSASPVPSKSSVITTMSSPLKVSSVSTATTVVSPSPCVKRKANHASCSKKLTKCKPQGKGGRAESPVIASDDDEQVPQVSKEEVKKKKKKKQTKKEVKHAKGKKATSSSLLRSSSKNGSGSKVSQVISNRESIESKRERKAAKTLAIITGAFVVCWLPFFVQALVLPICGDYCYVPPVVQETFQWLGYINSLINPIIYTIFSLEFRNAFKKLGNSILGRPAGFNYRHRPTAV